MAYLGPGVNEMEDLQGSLETGDAMGFFCARGGVRVVDRGPVRVGLQTWRQALAACFGCLLCQSRTEDTVQGSPGSTSAGTTPAVAVAL